MSNTYPLQRVLELACAAQRINGSYIRETQHIYSSDGQYMYAKTINKDLILSTLDDKLWRGAPADKPMPMKIALEDIDTADKIKHHYKKLMFAAVDGTDEFQTTINNLLTCEVVPLNRIGYIACLPSLYFRDAMHTNVKRAAKTVDEGWLGEVGQVLLDLDCEVLSVLRSKNYDAYNIDAKINNMLASWMSKEELTVGPAVIIKAKVKDCGRHWKHDQPVTRLNYVKAAQ